MHLTQDSYTDAAGVRVNTDDVDIWTAVAGAKYSRDIVKGDKTYRPEVHAGLTYDLLSDTTEANVAVGDYGYIVDTRRLPRFGVEMGAGMTIPIGADAGSLFMDAGVGLRNRAYEMNGTVGYRLSF